MRDDTKERIDKPEAFMDEQKLKQAQQAAISEYKKERFHFWKELVLRVCNFLWAARSRLIDVGGDSVTK